LRLCLLRLLLRCRALAPLVSPLFTPGPLAAILAPRLRSALLLLLRRCCPIAGAPGTATISTAIRWPLLRTLLRPFLTLLLALAAILIVLFPVLRPLGVRLWHNGPTGESDPARPRECGGHRQRQQFRALRTSYHCVSASTCADCRDAEHSVSAASVVTRLRTKSVGDMTF
jgi:hypothetical protein